MMALRHYQLHSLELLDAALAAGRKSPLLVQPTGAGKTVVAVAIIDRAVQRGQRCLFLAPRRELVHQASQKLGSLRHGLLLAGADDRQDLYATVQVGSIDTLLARVVRRKRLTLPDFDLVIVDEAHLSITAARQALLALWPNAIRIGLTATPTRRDGRALGLLYDELIEPASVATLQAQGFLVPARYFSLSEPDLSRVQTVAGDYHQGQLEAAINQPKLVGDVVTHCLTHAAGRRTIVFATSIKHSAALCEEFLRVGVAAEHVDANTPQELRDATFQRFREGQTQVLTNCFLASYGFDLPELSCVVLARPTKSLMLYLQMLGRGLRPAPGKRDCLVLDHSGAVLRHGFAHKERLWTLEGERALIEREGGIAERTEGKTLECPECSAVFAGSRLCPECGYYFAPKGKEVRTLQGELIEIGGHLDPEAQDRLGFFAELRGVAAEKGWKEGWAAHQFKQKFGAWPPNSWDATPPAQPSVETRRWVKSRLIAWLKGKERSGVAA